jgi:asparagine synthase (glutamine-hydrolysing)
MCGIAGIVSPRADELRDHVDAMLRALGHRGPDGSGIHCFPEAAVLGHVRLAIVDLESGKQPMLDATRRSAITFNGEIYGYQSLRSQLGDYPFHTTSDTEVILALYRKHGPSFVERLPGMFAFAIWDADSRELVCARDRFGEKPFFYAVTPRGEFVFASEIKAILASGLIEPRVRMRSVAHYLKRMYVHPRHTIYENINVLPPGHALVWKAGTVSVSPYWQLPAPQRMSLGEAAEKFSGLLQAAVQRQLVADVPVGAFLSGGLDSTTIVCAASQAVPRLLTFSFDFLGRHSEIEFARAAAKQYGTQHVELAADSVDVSRMLLKMNDVYDEPFGDSSAIPTFLLAQEARKHVKVVLTGDGGDELLGGYAWYKPLVWMQHQRATQLHWHLARVASRVARTLRLRSGPGWEDRALGLRARVQGRSVVDTHRDQLTFTSNAALRSWGFDDQMIHEDERSTQLEAVDSVDDAMRYDIIDYMPGDILTKIDRAAMAHGLELRAPFLDVELAEFCISLPAALKVNEREDKILLHAAFENRWPAAIRNRTKQGFGAPVTEWLRDRRVGELIDEYLNRSSAPIHSIIPPSAVRSTVESGSDYQRWAMLILGIWAARRPTTIAA